MNVYLVCSTAPNWMRTGYGAALLAGDQEHVLVSFAEFAARPDQPLAVEPLPPYQPKEKTDDKPQP